MQTGFTDAVAVGTSSLAITATQFPAGQNTSWKVRATGTDPSGRTRQAITTVTARPIFVNGFFTLDDFYLTGNQSYPQAYRSSVCPTASCETSPVPGAIGTNSTFSGSGVGHFADLWQGFNMYGRATQAAAEAACSGCPAAKVRAITDAMVVVVPTQPTPATCPAAGNGTISGTVQPGNYVCNVAVRLGNITVGSAGNGTGIVRLWVNNKVDLAGTVNANQVTKKFQLFVPPAPGGGVYDGSDFCDGTFFGLIDGPGLPIECHGSHQPEIYGAVIANIHSGTGNHFGFHWDLDAMGALNDGKYVVEDWRECPPSSTDC